MIFGSNLFFFLLLPLFCLIGDLWVLAPYFTTNVDVINVAVYDMSFPAVRLRNGNGMITETTVRNTGNVLAREKILSKMNDLTGLTFFSHTGRMLNSPPVFTSIQIT